MAVEVPYCYKDLGRKMAKKRDQVWVRLGDNGEYESFDGVDDFCGAHEDVSWGVFEGWVGRGFMTTAFPGRNYVSLYWGDDKANFVRELICSEKKVVEALVHLHPGKGNG